MVNLRISRSSKTIIIIALLLAADAHAQSWEAIAPMFQPRYAAACVVLKNGQILVAGGQDNTSPLSECELYDPLTNQWTVTGSLNQARYRHSLIALDDGRVLAIGGLTDLNIATTASCELYDPTTGTWTFTDSLSQPSEINSAFKLPNGKVFICDGANANIHFYLNLAYLYDPVSEKFQQLPDMATARTGLLSFCNPAADSIMVCGGNWGGLNGYYFRTTEIYSFATNQWTLADSTIEPHDNGQIMAIQMTDDKPLLISGRTGPNSLTQNIEAFDWNTGAWSHIGQMLRAQWHCYAFRVGNDSILLVGGSTPDDLNVTRHTTWYQYSTGNSWAGPDMIVATYSYTGLILAAPSNGCSDSEYVYVFGGSDTNSNALASCERLVVGTLASPFQAQPEQIHRESASAYFGQLDTLPLELDINASVNLDSLWPYLTDIQATYAWDSSVATYTTYLAPSGWSLSSLNSLGNAVTFEIHKLNASVTTPFDLGTALFQPTTNQLATTWVELPSLVLTVGGQKLSLCVTDNEDNHWAVKTLGVLSGVAPLTQAGEEFTVYPNPVEDELFVRNPGEQQAAVTIYDAIGRIVGTGTAEAESTTTIDTHALASGVYFARIACDGVGSSKVFVKE
jgi:hypothetical protein